MNTKAVVVIGKESSGKSQIIASLTGKQPEVGNFRGTTVSCEKYEWKDILFIDTPGILLKSDSKTTRTALEQLTKNDTVLVVVKATNLESDLLDLLPLVEGKHGIIIVTFADKVEVEKALEAMTTMRKEIGTEIIAVDARTIGITEAWAIAQALHSPRSFGGEKMNLRIPLEVHRPRILLLDLPIIGPILSFALLFLPALLAVHGANSFAGYLDPIVQSFLAPIIPPLQTLPSLPAEILVGRYGFITMGPLLLVWAVPTVLIYAFGLSIYKASGLIERITTSIHPFMRHFMITGRDLVRYIMGFGCNAAAVISTRACSDCTRRPTIQMIGYGSICSYQMGATLAVFAAAGKPNLVIPFLIIVIVTTMLYMRLTRWFYPPLGPDALAIEERNYLGWPTLRNVWREARLNILLFFRKALPIFFLITFIASMLDWFGVLGAIARIISPLMALFRLPGDAALTIVLASIRKDGLLIFASDEPLLASLTSLQVLTGVFLGGMLVPCIVTLFVSIREISWTYALRLLLRQIAFTLLFTLMIAWGGLLFTT